MDYRIKELEEEVKGLKAALVDIARFDLEPSPPVCTLQEIARKALDGE